MPKFSWGFPWDVPDPAGGSGRMIGNGEDVMLTLHILQGPDRGKRFSLPDNEPQLIGRSSEALPICDPSVSRRHAELTPDDGRWFVRDLDSANGTFVNGEQIAGRISLAPGDQIRCGSSLFLFAVNPDDIAKSPIRVMDADQLTATVERTVASPDLHNDDSMILASPDPMVAARGHLRIIYEVTAITASTIERDDMLERIMDLIFQRFEPDRGFILLQRGMQERPDPVVIRYRTRPKSRDEGHIPVSKTIVQHTLRRGQGVLSSNAMTDPRFRSGDSVREYGIRSAICVPIRAGERVFGVIHIDSSVANYTYTDEQLRLMTAIGQQTGLALTMHELLGERMSNERLAAIGETVASLSHSIKNILQGLRGGADALELALTRNDHELVQEAWPILSRNLDRIFSLTQNMLAYSKTRTPELEMTNLKTLIEEVVELMQPRADAGRIALLVDLDSTMPPIPIDANAIHQAIVNLVTNAIDAAPEKKGAVSITTSFDPAGNEARIQVTDNGRGIPKDQRERVFEVFTSTKGLRGTGLGLAVTKKIVEEHHGRLLLESEPGRGATFTIVLPTDLAPSDPSETKFPRPTPDESAW